MNEIKASIDTKYGVTQFTLQNIPLKVAIASSYGSIVLTFEIMGKGFSLYEG